jgi:hypothetical protein
MNPPPKYTRTAVGGSLSQDDSNSVDDDSNGAPPPAYSRQACHAVLTQDYHAVSTSDAQHNAEEGNTSQRTTISRPQQAYSPASHRGNPFVEDVRAWNAFQVSNLNSMSVRPAPRHGYRSRGDVENDGFHDRPPLRSPKYKRKFDFCLSHSSGGQGRRPCQSFKS